MGRRLPLLLGLALVAASAAVAPGLAFTTDASEQLPQINPRVTAWLELSRRFDAFNALLIGLEEPAGPLTADGLTRVKKVTDRLAALKAAGVLAVSSVTNVDSIREGEDGSLETELLVPSIPTDAAGLDALSKKILGNLQVSGSLISRDQRGYLLVLRADPRRPVGELARQIEQVVNEERGPMAAAYFGAPFFTRVIARGVEARLGWLLPALVLALLGVLAVFVRRVPVILLVIGATDAALLLCIGLLRLFGVALSVGSAPALLVLTALGAVAFSRQLEGGAMKVLPALVAIGLGAFGLSKIAFLSGFATVLGLGTVGLIATALLLVAPAASFLSEQEAPPPTRFFSPVMGVAIAGVVLAASGALATRARLYATPQTLFSETDEVGRSMEFFDRHFGGADFIQVDFQGDLRDPAVAARLMRLTDLLEGSPAFPDVRSAAQILSFLSHGFGGVHRIPASRESLGNLWFFLEGRPDVRNLVSDKRDEAMVVLRVASKPPRPVPELVAIVEQAVAESLEQGPKAAKLRLLALARLFQLPVTAEQVDAVLVAAAAPSSPEEDAALVAEVNAKLRTWLDSGDSPYPPTPEQWDQLSAALATPEAERHAKLAAVTASFAELKDPAMAGQLVDSILAREKDLRLNHRAAALAARLFTADPARVHAQGIFADLLDPQAGPGTAATITITGLPVVTAQIQQDLLQILWRGLGLLLGVGALFLFAWERQPSLALRRLLEAAVATTLTVAIAGALGMGIDSGCLTIFFVPPLASLLVSGSQRLPNGFLLAGAAGSATLLLVSLAPISRLGMAMAIGLACVAAVQAVSRRVG